MVYAYINVTPCNIDSFPYKLYFNKIIYLIERPKAGLKSCCRTI